ncbi:hypothetical protein Tco_0811258 [Tanacetum coccineum]
MTTIELNQLPLEPSHQEEFEHIVMNFILDQEEKVMQLKEYMKVIIGDFMQLSSEVVRRLKVKIREEGSKIREIEKITKYLDIEVSKPLTGHKYPKTPKKNMYLDALKSIPTNSLWIRYAPNHMGVRFRLGGEQKDISLLELGWRVGLYFERQSRESTTPSGLRKGVTVKANYLKALIGSPKLNYSTFIASTPMRSSATFHTDLLSTLSVKPSPHVFKKKSLISMEVVMELHNGECFWPAARELVEEDDKDDEAAEGMRVMKGLEVIFDEKKLGSS